MVKLADYLYYQMKALDEGRELIFHLLGWDESHGVTGFQKQAQMFPLLQDLKGHLVLRMRK